MKTELYDGMTRDEFFEDFMVFYKTLPQSERQEIARNCAIIAANEMSAAPALQAKNPALWDRIKHYVGQPNPEGLCA
ncbi:hypothetical protein KP005_19400 [Geomonas nitrogeniifigens]|uniref:Uncharacterized protein n=1 Tax=Geomonas diazotrophica TaxID=2843197 RepID=A0ABX8JGE7_9BACT|nr:hypothetical protein [Geomonas nitrogeniifigens]QWV97474.1 hypothetical protein KP005_19400 [Geomonas nitrogeniifigens]